MGKEQKAEIMGCQVDLLSLNQALEEIKKLLGNQKTFAHIITVNAEIIYEANKNPRLKEIINGAHMVTPDGIGVVWAARQFGYTSSGRVTGIELLEEVCSEGARRGWRVFFFGAAPGVAEKAASNLENKYPGLQVAGTINGYFAPEETADIVTTIKKRDPDILFDGL